MKELQKGDIIKLGIDSSILIQKNGEEVSILFESLFGLITIGIISKDDLCWFPQYTDFDYNLINKIVYLGDYKFGIKQLNSRLDEFNNLSLTEKNTILSVYFDLVEEKDNNILINNTINDYENNDSDYSSIEN